MVVLNWKLKECNHFVCLKHKIEKWRITWIIKDSTFVTFSVICFVHLVCISIMDAQVSIPGQPHPPPLQHLGDAASLLAAQNMHQNVQNMQRLLYTYRTIAAHTIGGPSSTSLEAKPGQLPATGGINGVYRQNSDNNNLVCPPNKKLTPLMYNTPWSLTAAAGIGERRRNSSSSSNGGASLASSTTAARNNLLATLASASRNNDGEASRFIYLFSPNIT